MKKISVSVLILIIVFFITGFFWSCEVEPGPGGEDPLEVDSVAELYSSYFTVGAAIGQTHLSTVNDIVAHHFNRVTCENDMKTQPMQPTEGVFAPDNADNVVAFAEANGMTMTGHALLWHQQAPDWMFEDLKTGYATDIETLKGRMKTHIEYMINRYDDVVDNWDVVNEACSDTYGKTYRDGDENSEWYRIFGSEEYIYWAFKYARDALDAIPGGSDAKLYYNDYSVPGSKLAKIMDLVDMVETGYNGAYTGVEIDGIGMQAHWSFGWPSTDQVQTAIDTIAAEGLEVKISELDISIYSSNSEAEKEFTETIEEEQAERYGDLFDVFRLNSDVITSVTFWGVSDDKTWLDTFPTTRNNYPLLFDDDHLTKAAYYAITDF